VRSWQHSIGRDAAIALYDSGWWNGKPAREIAEFQMHTTEMCMPFADFHKAIEATLGRPVWTHEFALDIDGLQAELMGEREKPSFAEIMALIPADKLVIVGVHATVGEDSIGKGPGS
jgi:hypothetical protein